MVFDRAGTVVRGAAVAGVLSGMADYVTANNGSAVTFEPNSGLAQFSPQKGAKMLEQGASKGIGNAGKLHLHAVSLALEGGFAALAKSPAVFSEFSGFSRIP